MIHNCNYNYTGVLLASFPDRVDSPIGLDRLYLHGRVYSNNKLVVKHAVNVYLILSLKIHAAREMT